MSQEGTILWALQPDPHRSPFASEGPTEHLIRAIEILVGEVNCEDRPAAVLLAALQLQKDVRGHDFKDHVQEAVHGVITWLQERDVTFAPPQEAIALLDRLHDGYHQAVIAIEGGHEAHKPALTYLIALFAPD
ncbi:hypothetical protein KBD18_00315 [Patescibacteria group bacterium]|nr:hypothetical protein [Patescibacteria group bacterium]